MLIQRWHLLRLDREEREVFFPDHPFIHALACTKIDPGPPAGPPYYGRGP